MTAGEFARKINVPYTTVATWLRKGQVPGAMAQTIGDFRVWMIPEDIVEGFERPKRGRPRRLKGQAEKAGAKSAKKSRRSRKK
ncbi:MAG: hypothetical protein IPM66_21580 [Acidobacteriota bacterium]|nr:MAG: hypothetical protein IPM66_21580 [Acidobacteriota bacterium]